MCQLESVVFSLTAMEVKLVGKISLKEGKEGQENGEYGVWLVRKVNMDSESI